MTTPALRGGRIRAGVETTPLSVYNAMLGYFKGILRVNVNEEKSMNNDE